MSWSSWAQAGVYSDGLMTTRLPAASISTSGPTERSKGKFQGTMLPTTPLGCGWTNALPEPKSAGSTSRGSGAIHASRRSAAYAARPATPRTSIRSVATVGCTPKSALIASWICVRCAMTIPASACRSARRSSSDGYGSARKAARWRSTICSSSAIAWVSSAVVTVSCSMSAMALLLLVRSLLHSERKEGSRETLQLPMASRSLLVAGLTALALWLAAPAQASVDRWGYIPLADGTQLRYTVTLPAAEGRFPVALDYDGYCEGTGATRSNDVDMATKLVSAGYAVLGVSMRGTGCSTGTFDFRSPQEHADGAAAVEWAARQPWSTGRVGMFGDSFPGLSQPGVAALRPHGLAAIAPFQIVDDLYRDVAYPGGISNGEFGAFWGLGDQPAADASGTLSGVQQGDPQCAANYAAHQAQK